MSNEEAIAIIRNEYKCVDRDCNIERSCGKCDLMMPSKEPILEAYKMAIKALEQQPCDDAISRKSIKQKLQEQHDFFVNAYGGFSNLSQNGKSRVYEITNCISMVVNEPPVTPQQKYGKWILLDECANSGYYCSNCQKKLVKEGWSNTVKKIKYCPNCGCRMVEPQESEEV